MGRIQLLISAKGTCTITVDFWKPLLNFAKSVSLVPSQKLVLVTTKMMFVKVFGILMFESQIVAGFFESAYLSICNKRI